jgi:hypothetical protein
MEHIGREGQIAVGNSKDKALATEKNLLSWLVDEFPVLRNEPHIEDLLKKKANTVISPY